jgi:mannonate dehydratase
MGKDVVETIRAFGRQNKIWKVHFRNVNAPLPHFVETLMDNGYYEMSRIMEALVEVKFDGIVILDHTPALVGGGNAPTAYGVAYMTGLWRRALAGRKA